jgi:hypothetical protein
LTRRANHRHILIIAKVHKARAGKTGPRAFSVRTALGICMTPHLSMSIFSPDASQGELPSDPFIRTFTGMRERAGTRRGPEAMSARGPREGIGFAPEMIPPRADHAADLTPKQQEAGMTAYLISLTRSA